MTANRRRWQIALQELTIALMFVVLSIAMTWPLAAHLSAAVRGPGDPYVSASILEWDLRTLVSHPGSVFHLPWFHPSRFALAFTEHLLGIALPLLPFYLAGASAITLHSIGMILGFAFCGYAAFVLGRVVTGSISAGLVAGVFYAFLPYRFHHLTHISYVWSGWLPLLLASLIWYSRAPGWKLAVLAGAVFLMNGLTCMHWLAFGSVAFAATAVAASLSANRLFDRRWWIPLMTATGLAVVLLLPVLAPYRTVSRLYGMERSWADAEPFSGTWKDWLMVARENSLYSHWSPAERYEGEHPLFPGFGVLLLATSALLLTRREDFPNAPEVSTWGQTPGGNPRPRNLIAALDAVAGSAALFALIVAIRGPIHWSLLDVSSTAVPLLVLVTALLIRLGYIRPASRLPPPMWWALLWIGIGVIGSLGLNAFLHAALFKLVPLFRGMRVPLRWSMIAYVGLAVLAAAGMLPLLRNRRPWPRRAITTAALILLLFELRAAPFHWYLAPETPPVYRWLSSVEPGAVVLEFPLAQDLADYEYLLHQAVHHHPLVNGISSFTPPGYDELLSMARTDPVKPAFLDRLKQLGAALIVVHVHELASRRPAVRSWLRTEIENGRLAFVRRFDHHVWGDYVFALIPEGRAALRWREPEVPDPSGRTPNETLNVFLEHDRPTYNRDTFGWLDLPLPGQDVRGELRVAGWAFSPNGVSQVNILIDDGRIRIPAEKSDTAWLFNSFPWYGREHAGFQKTIALAPDDLGDVTDIQVEITDGRGRTSRLDDRDFRWSNRAGLAAGDWNVEALDGLLERMSLGPDHAAVQRRLLTAGDLTIRLVEQTRGRSDDDFIATTFRIVFGQPPDSRTRKRWRDKLSRGELRISVIDACFSSPEFRNLYLRSGATMEDLR